MVSILLPHPEEHRRSIPSGSYCHRHCTAFIVTFKELAPLLDIFPAILGSRIGECSCSSDDAVADALELGLRHILDRPLLPMLQGPNPSSLVNIKRLQVRARRALVPSFDLYTILDTLPCSLISIGHPAGR